MKHYRPISVLIILALITILLLILTTYYSVFKTFMNNEIFTPFRSSFLLSNSEGERDIYEHWIPLDLPYIILWVSALNHLDDCVIPYA